MTRLWGEVAPVPEDNLIPLAGGEEVGFRVLHTPGHASHHVCYLDLDAGDAYVGDMAGVRIPPTGLTLAPTPPPEIDVEAWLDSVDRIEALEPARLRLTHFGVAEDVAAARALAREPAPQAPSSRGAAVPPSSRPSRPRSTPTPTRRRRSGRARRHTPSSSGSDSGAIGAAARTAAATEIL